MVLNIKKLALASAFLMVAVPAFAQVPPQVNPLGIDLDPLHLFSPAPMAAPEAAPPMMKKHRMMKRRMMMKKPMMKKPMMMKKKMMMKKPMMMKK